jgi:hypothetical protein
MRSSKMKLNSQFNLQLMICIGSILPGLCYSAKPSDINPKPLKENSKPLKAEKIPISNSKNFDSGYRNSENYYRQPEDIPPSPSAYDSQEILALIEDQIMAIQMTDASKAYYAFTADKFRDVTSLEEFKYFIDSFPVFSKNKNALFGNFEFKDGIASIQGTLTATTGETLKVEYDFVKEGPQWKIIGIRLLKPPVKQEVLNPSRLENPPQPYQLQPGPQPN